MGEPEETLRDDSLNRCSAAGRAYGGRRGSPCAPQPPISPYVPNATPHVVGKPPCLPSLLPQYTCCRPSLPSSLPPHLNCQLVLGEVDALVLLELGNKVLEDGVVKVLACSQHPSLRQRPSLPGRASNPPDVHQNRTRAFTSWVLCAAYVAAISPNPLPSSLPPHLPGRCPRWWP
jgi:hypothetical protein